MISAWGILIATFFVCITIGAVYGVVAHSMAKQLAKELRLTNNKLKRALARLEKLESSFSNKLDSSFSSSLQASVAIHNKKLDSSQAQMACHTDKPAYNDKNAIDCQKATPTSYSDNNNAIGKNLDSTPMRARFSLERLFTQKGLVIIAGVFFILAAFFLVRYSIEHSLMSPAVRIGLALAFGALLLGSGVAKPLFTQLGRRISRDKSLHLIAQTCVGSGLVVEFFALYGGYYFYGFFGITGAFVGLCLVALLGLVLSLRFGLVIGGFGVLGGFSTPLLMASDGYNGSVLFIYVAIFYILAALISQKSAQAGHKGSLWIFILATFFVLAYALDFSLNHFDTNARWVVLLTLLVLLVAHIWLGQGEASSLSLGNPLGVSFAISTAIVCVAMWICSVRGYGFSALDWLFLLMLCGCLLVLPALSKFVRYTIHPLYLSLPIPFSMLMSVGVIVSAGASGWGSVALMCVFVGALLLYSYKQQRLRLWYLWNLWLCGAVFMGLMVVDGGSFDGYVYAIALLALGIAVGIYYLVIYYHLNPTKDYLLLACAALLFATLWLIDYGSWLESILLGSMKLQILWLLSAAILVAMPSPLLPRVIAGFVWVFVGLGVLGLLAQLDRVLEATLFARYYFFKNYAFFYPLFMYFATSVLNLWLLLRYKQKLGAIKQLSNIIKALGALTLWLLIIACNLLSIKLLTAVLQVQFMTIEPLLSACLLLAAGVIAAHFGKPCHTAWLALLLVSGLFVLWTLGIILGIMSSHLPLRLYDNIPATRKILYIFIALTPIVLGLMIWLAKASRPYFGTMLARAAFIGLDGIIIFASVVTTMFAIRFAFIGEELITLMQDSARLFPPISNEIELYSYTLAFVALGVLMLALYFATAYKAFRIYSLVLLGIAALKVLFIDASGLGSLAKITLFIAMGVVFLLISYVYSKYVFVKDSRLDSSR